jgi:hypothetical protein
LRHEKACEKRGRASVPTKTPKEITFVTYLIIFCIQLKQDKNCKSRHSCLVVAPPGSTLSGGREK